MKPKDLTTITHLAQRALTEGYRVTPIYEGGALGPYTAGQDYSDLNDPAWRGAVKVGIILDDAVLLDYDGHSADAEGSFIPTLEQLPKVVGVDILPPPAQVGKNGRSVHYLFKLPPGEYKASADGKLMPRIDIKCQNQVMHLSPEKQLKLPSKSALTVAPKKLLDLLSKSGERAYTSFEEHEHALYSDNTGWHSAVIGLTGKMVSRGWSDDEIWDYFNQARPRLAALRPDRVDALYADSIPRGIDSARDKGWTPVVPFEEEEVEKSVWDDWVCITSEEKFYNLANGIKLNEKGFNYQLATENTWVGKVEYSPAKYAIKIAQIPAVVHGIYAPKFGQFFEYQGKSCVNLYLPNMVPKAAKTFTPLYQQLVENMFPDDYKIITQWMAWVVRHPGQKVQWALLLKGVQGDGKTTLANILRKAVGTLNAREVEQREINSNFSAWAPGHCLKILEEVRFSDKNRHAIMDSLKALITNDVITYVGKNKDGMEVLNTANYILLTNHEDALALDDGDRRYGVFFTRHKNREEVKTTLGPFYKAIRDTLELDDGSSARAWLESIDLSDFDPRKAPETTAAKQYMIALGKPEHVDVLETILNNPLPGVHEEVFSVAAVNRAIQEVLCGRPIPHKLMAKTAAALGYEKYPRMVRWNGMPQHIYVKQGLQEISPEIIRLRLNEANSFESG